MPLVTLSLDEDIFEQKFNQETLEEFLRIGFILYQHHVSNKLSEIMEGNIEMIINQRCVDKLENLQKENSDLARKNELEHAHYQSVIKDLKDDKKELQGKLDGLYKSVYEDSVQKLKDEIKKKDSEISALKSTNMVKGTIGENNIMNVLRETFTDCMIENTGKTSHACDVHMTLPEDKGKIVFESKYKSCIEKRDIDKFIRDVEEMSGVVDGAVFVSLCSLNIPHKGDMYFEVVAGVPVLYIGFDNEDDFKSMFAKHMRMFVDLCETHKGIKREGHDSEEKLTALLEDYKFIHNILSKNKKRLDDMRTKFLKFAAETEDDTKCMLEKMESFLGTAKKKQPRSIRRKQ